MIQSFSFDSNTAGPTIQSRPSRVVVLALPTLVPLKIIQSHVGEKMVKFMISRLNYEYLITSKRLPVDESGVRIR